MIALLAIGTAVVDDHQPPRIVEYRGSGVEVDAVFGKIADNLERIPFTPTLYGCAV